MNGDTIKEFLVGLGFQVDDASYAKFNNSIKSASIRVLALFGAVKAANAGILYGIKAVSEGFEQMGYEYRIIAPMINKTLVLRREMLKAFSAAGINITQVVRQSVLLNMSLTKTKFAFEAIYKSVAARFFPLLTKQSDIFRKKIYDNMPKIQDSLERFVKFIFKALEATVTLGTRVWSILSRIYDFFVQLDKATNGWSTVILGVLAAWKLLNLAFLATPLGMLIAGIITLISLYDDFKVWEEGGESFFNWSSFVPVIEAVKGALISVRNVLDSIFTVIFNVIGAITDLFSLSTDAYAMQRMFDRWAEAGKALLAIFGGLGETLKSIWELSGQVGKWAGDNIAEKFGAMFGGGGAPSPQALGTTTTSNANQNVNQQTTISVNGSADANSTAKAVASQQNRVNFDMTRNLKGAVR